MALHSAALRFQFFWLFVEVCCAVSLEVNCFDQETPFLCLVSCSRYVFSFANLQRREFHGFEYSVMEGSRKGFASCDW